MLAEKTLIALKAKLEQERESILSLNRSGSEKRAEIELDQSKVGRLSRMDALAGAQMSAETERRRQHRLVLIKRALKKIESGLFGECDECLQEIAPARLELNPAVELCIDCATKAEQ